MSYLLDTNVFIQLMSGRPAVRENFEQFTRSGSMLFLSSLVYFELCYGVERSARVEANRVRLHRIIGTDFNWLSFDDRSAAAAARIRAELNRRKQPIGPYDTLIAGQAVAHGLTLVTSNTNEFSRVDGLTLMDWSVPVIF